MCRPGSWWGSRIVRWSSCSASTVAARSRSACCRSGPRSARSFPRRVRRKGSSPTLPLSRTEYAFEAITVANEAGRLASPEEVERWRDRTGASDRGSRPGGRPTRGCGRRHGRGRRRDPATRVRARVRIGSDAARGSPRRAWTRHSRRPERSRAGRLAPDRALPHHQPGRRPQARAYVWRTSPPPSRRRLPEPGGVPVSRPAARRGRLGDGVPHGRPPGDVRAAWRARLPSGGSLEAGTVAGKVYLASYAHRLGATGLTFFDDEVERFFSPDAVGKSCMLVVAVGDSPRLHRGG